MNTPEVLIEHADGLVIITINRPQQKNAVNRAVSYGVCEAIDEMERNPNLHAAILTGAGGTFCSGMDLKAFLQGESPRVVGRGIFGIVMTPPKKPLIAAVEGYCLAGGFEAMLACDLVVTARTAVFGIPEVKRGLAAAAGGLMRLPRLVPHRIAMEMALTGEMYPAERLAPYGLFNAVVEPGQALPEAIALARRVIANAPLSVAASKRVIVEFSPVPADDAGELVIRIEDQGEGFVPEEVADPLAPENILKSSGRGIFLIRNFMDETVLKKVPGGMEIRMVKKIANAGRPPI